MSFTIYQCEERKGERWKREWLTAAEHHAQEWVAETSQDGWTNCRRYVAVEVSLSPDDIVNGGRYRARKPRRISNVCHRDFGKFADRCVIWTNGKSVQYDSASVADGRQYPAVSLLEFLLWAGGRVTDLSETAGAFQEGDDQ
jgi:hypothetical protein